MYFHPQWMGHWLWGHLSETHAVGREQRFLNMGGFVVPPSVPEELARENADSLHTAVTRSDHSLTNDSIKHPSGLRLSTFSSGAM